MKILFRVLIILLLSFVILGAVVNVIFKQNHPEIENFLTTMDSGDIFSKMSDVQAVIVGMLIVIACFVINVGLFWFKSWARDANLVLILIGFSMAPFSGLTIQSSLEALFYDLGTFIGGVVLALSYFSVLRYKFKESAISRALNRLSEEN